MFLAAVFTIKIFLAKIANMIFLQYASEYDFWGFGEILRRDCKYLWFFFGLNGYLNFPSSVCSNSLLLSLFLISRHFWISKKPTRRPSDPRSTLKSSAGSIFVAEGWASSCFVKLVLSDVENFILKNFYCAKRFVVKFQGESFERVFHMTPSSGWNHWFTSLSKLTGK